MGFGAVQPNKTVKVAESRISLNLGITFPKEDCKMWAIITEIE
ncbi:hypothetical protein F544_16850 [Bibersteinia trehalosi USDA-ARS-USMARC-190]|uniref:Uncharacterized protein n=1 Tax=Bibersteinia trehalosi USDA-ARS-USMARC-190 TaxID=1263832 RepID=W0RBZ9_BIBTR|nr:hypothetical protein F544_16850 [Bibersteinia trehalosi USDA-ARS-USMARC-190]